MSNETKWTQGEWAVESECWLEDHISIGAPDWGAMILVAYQGDESTANAHLIAAAKDLYAALDGLCGVLDWPADYPEKIKAAEKALAKARGQQCK